MISERSSNFSVVGLILMVAALAFYGGRHSVLSRQANVKQAAPQAIQSTPEVSPKPVAPVYVDSAPKATDQTVNWAELSAQPDTPAGENDMADFIEKLAETDPLHALSLAEGQANIRLRSELLRAALKGWGKTNPDAAATWALSETVMDREQAVGALLQGAVDNPGEAVSVANSLIQSDAAHGSQYGSDLIWAFADAGQFSQAADFAANGPQNDRDDWMMAAYSRWAEFQPQAALASATQLQDPAIQQSALNAIIVGWSPTDPQGMAQFALNNLSGQQQSTAISRALTFWADSDPVAAANWINQNNLGSQSDTGIAEIATSAQLLAQDPAAAASWAQTITDPQLRSRTLAQVFETWAQSNPSAAKQFLDTSSVIQGDDRQTLLAEINSPSP